ncbi:MAG TPA: glycosyltransferase family 9 protein [Chthoniobacteraceae bacterium]|nr:glycosyltransferase family 9 protein [Chthoniobacteraceae bacterium]
MSGSILVIRGGAIGDFILTLPAIALLRKAFPEARLEILGYRHIISLAHERYYAHATRSIEYAGMASFFIPGGKLPEDLVAYFAGFSQVISYLYDPDGFFEANLRRAGVKQLIVGEPRLDLSAHAARQLARPLERLALYLEPEGERAPLHLHADDHAFADRFLKGSRPPLVAIHPGSGGAHKLWPLEHWQKFLEGLSHHPAAPGVLLVGGEADERQLETLSRTAPASLSLKLAQNLPLPHLAAVLARCPLFVGHDSGISHLAAAAGTRSFLLFGPTDPAVWGPTGGHVTILPAPEGDLSRISPEELLSQLAPSL